MPKTPKISHKKASRHQKRGGLVVAEGSPEDLAAFIEQLRKLTQQQNCNGTNTNQTTSAPFSTNQVQVTHVTGQTEQLSFDDVLNHITNVLVNGVSELNKLEGFNLSVVDEYLAGNLRKIRLALASTTILKTGINAALKFIPNESIQRLARTLTDSVMKHPKFEPLIEHLRELLNIGELSSITVQQLHETLRIAYPIISSIQDTALGNLTKHGLDTTRISNMLTSINDKDESKITQPSEKKLVQVVIGILENKTSEELSTIIEPKENDTPEKAEEEEQENGVEKLVNSLGGGKFNTYVATRKKCTILKKGKPLQRTVYINKRGTEFVKCKNDKTGAYQYKPLSKCKLMPLETSSKPEKKVKK
jgi:hypothetical protein